MRPRSCASRRSGSAGALAHDESPAAARSARSGSSQSRSAARAASRLPHRRQRVGPRPGQAQRDAERLRPRRRRRCPSRRPARTRAGRRRPRSSARACPRETPRAARSRGPRPRRSRRRSAPRRRARGASRRRPGRASARARRRRARPRACAGVSSSGPRPTNTARASGACGSASRSSAGPLPLVEPSRPRAPCRPSGPLRYRPASGGGWYSGSARIPLKRSEPRRHRLRVGEHLARLRQADPVDLGDDFARPAVLGRRGEVAVGRPELVVGLPVLVDEPHDLVGMPDRRSVGKRVAITASTGPPAGLGQVEAAPGDGAADEVEALALGQRDRDEVRLDAALASAPRSAGARAAPRPPSAKGVWTARTRTRRGSQGAVRARGRSGRSPAGRRAARSASVSFVASLLEPLRRRQGRAVLDARRPSKPAASARKRRASGGTGRTCVGSR